MFQQSYSTAVVRGGNEAVEVYHLRDGMKLAALCVCSLAVSPPSLFVLFDWVVELNP